MRRGERAGGDVRRVILVYYLQMKRLVSCVVATVSVAFGVWAGTSVPVPLADVANASRQDDEAADGKGGWLDLGSDDLRVLPAGEASYAGVSFVVPPAGGETAKNCLILGRKGAEEAALKLEVRGQRLYLLHAIAGGPAPETHEKIGEISLRYADGTSVRRDVCVGADVSDWTCGRSFANAARAWTEYNHNTQVSLFVSQFALKPEATLTEVSFSSGGKCPWMIVAATVADKVRLRPIRGSVEPTGAFKSPEPPSGLGRFPVGRKPKNVILIVGDGMGQGSVQLASFYKYGRADGVYFHKLPVVGFCTTFSANRPVTDSAASATAFATGTKTSNGVLGLQVDEKHDRTHAVRLVSVAARAKAGGRGVAILTSDSLYGATPGAFYAHVLSRGDAQTVCEQAAASGYDVLVGAVGTEAWLRPSAKGGKRTDGRDLVVEMEKKGYRFVRTVAELAAAPKAAKVVGSLEEFCADESARDEESLGQAMKAVLGRLGDRSEGFFMMAECTETDHANHGNNSSAAVKTVSMVEFMAKAAVDFAQGRGDTLVVVTADHDTGHPLVLRDPSGRLCVQWTDTAHTKYPVPVHAYGPGAELFEGMLDNTDIAKNVARLMGLGE